MIYEDLDNLDSVNTEPIEEEALMTDVEDFESTGAYDQYILETVMLPKDDGFSWALFMKQKRDSDANIIGYCHSNPFLDNIVYKVRFQDGLISKYGANLIAENIYSQTDPDDNEFLFLNYIFDYRSTDMALEARTFFRG